MHASILIVVVVVMVMALQQAETQTTSPPPSCVDIARQSRPGMLGGWRKRGSAESPELRQVVKDMAIQAIQSYFDNGQTPTWRVTEVYTQVRVYYTQLFHGCIVSILFTANSSYRQKLDSEICMKQRQMITCPARTSLFFVYDCYRLWLE